MSQEEWLECLDAADSAVLAVVAASDQSMEWLDFLDRCDVEVLAVVCRDVAAGEMTA